MNVMSGSVADALQRTFSQPQPQPQQQQKEDGPRTFSAPPTIQDTPITQQHLQPQHPQHPQHPQQQHDVIKSIVEAAIAAATSSIHNHDSNSNSTVDAHFACSASASASASADASAAQMRLRRSRCCPGCPRGWCNDAYDQYFQSPTKYVAAAKQQEQQEQQQEQQEQQKRSMSVADLSSGAILCAVCCILLAA